MATPLLSNPVIKAIYKKAPSIKVLLAMLVGSHLESSWTTKAVGSGSYGAFQIQLTAHPGVTQQEAETPTWSVNYILPSYKAAVNQISNNTWKANPLAAATHAAALAERPTAGGGSQQNAYTTRRPKTVAISQTAALAVAGNLLKTPNITPPGYPGEATTATLFTASSDTLNIKNAPKNATNPNVNTPKAQSIGPTLNGKGVYASGTPNCVVSLPNPFPFTTGQWCLLNKSQLKALKGATAIVAGGFIGLLGILSISAAGFGAGKGQLSQLSGLLPGPIGGAFKAGNRVQSATAKPTVDADDRQFEKLPPATKSRITRENNERPFDKSDEVGTRSQSERRRAATRTVSRSRQPAAA